MNPALRKLVTERSRQVLKASLAFHTCERIYGWTKEILTPSQKDVFCYSVERCAVLAVGARQQ